MDRVGDSTLRSAIVALLALGAGALTFLQLGTLAMATSHPGLAGNAMIGQRLVATSCSGAAVLVVVAAAFRRGLPAARLAFVLAFTCASLACGFVLASTDSREWNRASVVLTGLTVVLLVVAVRFLIVSNRDRPR
jgi:hypothetical protein